MSAIKFRVAHTDDADAIAHLVNAAYRPAPGEGGWTHEAELVSGMRTTPRQLLAIMADSVVLVGMMDAGIVACANIAFDSDVAHIGMLAVAPALQGSGLGKQLLSAAESYACVELGAKKLRLLVVSVRDELIRFYERRGYQRTGLRQDYPVDADVGTPRSGTLALETLEKVPAPVITTTPC